jgi:hypothetical protein
VLPTAAIKIKNIMEDKPTTSMEVNYSGSLPEKVNKEVWTKSLKYMPNITYGEIEKHLILSYWIRIKFQNKTSRSIETQKRGYKLFKAGYTSDIWIKSDIKKQGVIVHFLVRCQVSAEMKTKAYTCMYMSI